MIKCHYRAGLVPAMLVSGLVTALLSGCGGVTVGPLPSAPATVTETVEQGDLTGMMDTNLAFHEAIGAACGNRLVAKHYAQLLAFGLRLSRISLAYEGTETRRDEHIGTIVEEHREMLQHIVSGDADAAEEIARSHTELFRKRVLEYMSTNLAAEMSF